MDASVESKPLYRQVRDLLRARIVDGTWPPGHYLPTEMQLAGQLHVSVGTVRKSMEELVQQGLLERLHGRGTRVVAQSSERTRFRFYRFQRAGGTRFVPQGRIVGVSRRRATAAERNLFELPPDGRVIAISRERLDGTRVVAIEAISLPEPAFAALDLDAEIVASEELYVVYQQQCGVTIVATSDELSAELADGTTGNALGVRPGTALLRITRHAFSLDGKVAELRITRTAALHYRVDLE